MTADQTSDTFRIELPQNPELPLDALEAHSDFPIAVVLKNQSGAVIRTGKAQLGDEIGD